MANSNTQIQAIDITQIQAIGQWGLAEVQTLKETIGKDCSVPQFNLFMYQVNRMGLDPFLKHAFPIVYGGKLDIRVSYEGFLSKAKECEDYEGVFNQVICENETDSFLAETDDEGVITKISHKIRFPRGKVVGAYSIAKRKGARDVIVLMETSEVMKYVKKNPNFWKLEDGSIDPDMFKKHVGTRAVKAQFNIAAAIDESGEFVVSETSEPIRRDITAEVNAAAAETKQPAEAPKTEPAPQTNDAAELKKYREKMKENFEKLGITTPEGMEDYIKKNAKIKGEKPTATEYKALLKVMDLHIAERQAEQDVLPL